MQTFAAILSLIQIQEETEKGNSYSYIHGWQSRGGATSLSRGSGRT